VPHGRLLPFQRPPGVPLRVPLDLSFPVGLVASRQQELDVHRLEW